MKTYDALVGFVLLAALSFMIRRPVYRHSGFAGVWITTNGFTQVFWTNRNLWYSTEGQIWLDGNGLHGSNSPGGLYFVRHGINIDGFNFQKGR